MNALFGYSIGITIPLLIFWGIYKLMLARATFHRFNRATLLLIYVLALVVVPAIQAIPTDTSAAYTINLNIVKISGQAATLTEATHAPGTWSIGHILPYLYMAGVTLAVVTTLISLLRIAIMIKGSERIKRDGHTIAVHERNGVVPFSWGKYVVISRKDYEDGGDYVIAHELSHLRSRHWLDLLLAQAVICINWFNPAAWLMRHELQDVHEYAADEAVIKSNILTPEQYQLFLIKKTAGARFAAIANSLNHSSLKKRITMMLSKKSRGVARMRALALVPAAALALVFVNKPVEAIAAPDETKSPDKVTKKNYNANEVEQMAEFPGGEAALYKFLAENLKFPEDAKSGTVVIQFTISETGKVVNPKIVRGLSESMNKEALRVIGQLPDFTPAKVDGKNVALIYTLPIMFTDK